MTEMLDGPVALNPLLQRWLDDVSRLSADIIERDEVIASKANHVDPEYVDRLHSLVADLYERLQQSREDRDKTVASVEEKVQQVKDEADAKIREKEESLAETLRIQTESFQERDQARLTELEEVRSNLRSMRLELARERVEGYKRAMADINKEHKKAVAKSNQTGKNKGIAIATAYIESAKECGADLGRASELASKVVIQSAQRIESDLSLVAGVIGEADDLPLFSTESADKKPAEEVNEVDEDVEDNDADSEEETEENDENAKTPRKIFSFARRMN